MTETGLDPRLHLGTASWSSEDWVGPFYPEGTAPGKFLPHYAGVYETVEVDSTFYRPPSAYLCQKWRRDTPENFRFALKVTRTITHEKVLEGAEKDFEEFLGAAEELGDRLGFVVFQFGYFNKQSACPDLGAFLKRLSAFAKACPPRHDYVVEIRNPRWIGEDLLEALRGLRLSLALTDQQWMPRPGALWDRFGDRLLTREFAYIRFLGERERIEKLTTKWDKVVIDRTKETQEWIPLVRRFLAKEIPVWAYFNNHFSGYAPASIDLFRRLWQEAT